MTKDLFRKKLEKTAILSGQLIDKHLPDALFEEIKEENHKDILLALKDIAFSGDKICLGNIMKHLFKHRADRFEKEAEELKKQEKQDIEDFIKDREIPREVREFLKQLKGL
jgi:hypothetical protein